LYPANPKAAEEGGRLWSKRAEAWTLSGSQNPDCYSENSLKVSRNNKWDRFLDVEGSHYLSLSTGVWTGLPYQGGGNRDKKKKEKGKPTPKRKKKNS